MCAVIEMPRATTFESVCVKLTTAGGAFILLTVYRRGSEKQSATFFTELATVLEIFVPQSCAVVVGGDFSIGLDRVDDADAVKLIESFATVPACNM